MAVRLGILYPGEAAADDYAALTQKVRPAAAVLLQRTPVPEDAHTVPALRELGHSERLVPRAGHCRRNGAQAVIWACTSGGFVRGPDGAAEQVRRLGAAAGRPATNTALAYVAALQALELTRVAVSATYPEPVAVLFDEFLQMHGIEIVRRTCRNIPSAAAAGHLRAASVDRFIDGDDPRAQALLVPDTALHTADRIESWERRLGKPVLTANQVTLWGAMTLAGADPTAGPGRLFQTS